MGGAAGHVIEVTDVIGRANTPVGVALDEVELDLGVDVAGEADLGDAGELALQDRARVGAGGFAVGGEHVAEHAGHRVGARAPQQELEDVPISSDI